MIKALYAKLLIIILFISASTQLHAACNWSKVNTNWSATVNGGNISVGMNTYNNPCIKLLWSLSGGTGVKGYQANFTVTKNGTYKICLKLIDSCNKCDTVICKDVKVDGISSCKVDFTATISRDGVKFKPSFPCNGKAVYAWKFGNGTFSGDYDPFVKYKKGTYEVCLTAKCYTYNQDTKKYDSCTAKICKKIIIKENPCELKGNFTFKIGDKGEVIFEGSANEKNLLYHWTIDQIFRKGRDFKMTLSPGAHKICLTIYNPKTNCKITICKTIEIPKPKPECKVDFIAEITKDGVKFKPLFPCNGVATYFWKLGNGTSSNHIDPFVKYAKGSYEVCLYAKCKFYNQAKQAYDSCESKICKKIIIKENPCELKGDYTFKIGPNNEVTFIGTGNGQNLLYYWTIDNISKKGRDFKMVLTPGIHKVCLTIYDQKSNCKIIICKTIEIKGHEKCNLPKGWSQTNPNCSTYVFDGYKVIDANNNIITNPCHKYSWSFGDGTYASGKEAKHEYKTSGTYTVCMKVIDTCRKCDTVICKTITVNCTNNKCNLPKGWAYGNKVCSTFSFEGFMSVMNNSAYLNPCHKYYWSFGDNTYGTGRNVNHSYSKNGTYNVCMKVIDTCNKCDTIICKTIKVSCCNPNMNAEFSDTIKLGGTVKFVNHSTNSVYYKWLFGDGTSSTDKNISHTFTSAGGYKVCLIAYDSSKNCTDTFCKYIQVTIKRGSEAGLLNQRTDNYWQLYPNPASDEVNISGFRLNNGDMITIRDITGKIVQILEVSEGTSNLNIRTSDMVPGIYTIECQTIDGRSIQSKLIKQ